MRADRSSPPIQGASEPIRLRFDDLQFALVVADEQLRLVLLEAFADLLAEKKNSVVATAYVEVDEAGTLFFAERGKKATPLPSAAFLVERVQEWIRRRLGRSGRRYLWLRGVTMAREEIGVALPGDLADPGSLDFVEAATASGWRMLARGLCPIRLADQHLLPFGSPEAGRSGSVGAKPLGGCVVAVRRLANRPRRVLLEPALAVAELFSTASSRERDPGRVLRDLCALVEEVAVAQVLFAHPEDVLSAADRMASTTAGGGFSPEP